MITKEEFKKKVAEFDQRWPSVVEFNLQGLESSRKLANDLRQWDPQLAACFDAEAEGTAKVIEAQRALGAHLAKVLEPVR